MHLCIYAFPSAVPLSIPRKNGTIYKYFIFVQDIKDSMEPMMFPLEKMLFSVSKFKNATKQTLINIKPKVRFCFLQCCGSISFCSGSVSLIVVPDLDPPTWIGSGLGKPLIRIRILVRPKIQKLFTKSFLIFFFIISTFILLNNMDLFYDSRPSVTGPFGTGSGFRKKRTRILVSQKKPDRIRLRNRTNWSLRWNCLRLLGSSDRPLI